MSSIVPYVWGLVRYLLPLFVHLLIESYTVKKDDKTPPTTSLPIVECPRGDCPLRHW